MEESAYLADLVYDDPRPIVFTGVQLRGGSVFAGDLSPWQARLLLAAALALAPDDPQRVLPQHLAV